MKFLFDLFPVFVFFAAFKFADIYVATVTVIVATAAQIAWVWWRHGRVDTMLWVSLALVAIFGGATLLLHDETFIKWKPTVLYWLFAAAFGIAEFGFGKNLMKAVLGRELALPEPVWRKVLWSWIGFFAVMGLVNLYVAFNYPTDTWVNFKLFGFMGLMFVFVIGQGVMLAKYVEHEPDNKEP